MSQRLNRWVLCLALVFLQKSIATAQFYNKEIVARISVEKSSEFYTFKATAENKTPTDYGLKYDYSIYITNEDSTVTKSNQENRFFLRGNDKKVLNQLTVNYNLENRTTIALIIYDKDGKPIGKDRIVLDQGGRTELYTEDRRPTIATGDQAKPQDGFKRKGFIKKKLITKSGKDFFRYFYADFYNRDITTDKNILIEETFGRGRNTRIIVKVEDQIVAQFFAQPRKAFLEDVARQSLGLCLRKIQQLDREDEQLIRY